MNTPETPLFQSRIFDIVRMYQTDDQGNRHARDIIRHPGAVVILPVLDDGRIVLIENVRVAAGGTLIELPAGTREPDEEPLLTAHRELAEETGYTAAKMELLTSFYSSPGCMRELMHLYIATGLTPGEMQTEAGEQITVKIVEFDEAMRMVFDGTIRDAKTLVGLLWHAATVKDA